MSHRRGCEEAAADVAHLGPGGEARVGDEGSGGAGDRRQLAQRGVELARRVLLQLARQGRLQPWRAAAVLILGCD